MTLQQKFHDLKAQTNSWVFGLENFVDALGLAFPSATHVLAKGDPGTAKSHTIRIWLAGIEGAGEASFFKDFSRTTTATKVFGNLDLKLLRETGEQRHRGARYAQNARFVYFNEVGRAGPGVLDDTLLLINERQFKDGDELINTPLLTAICDTNSDLDDPEMAAFYDRLHQRVWVTELNDADQFMVMLMQNDLAIETVMSLGDVEKAIAEVRQVKMTPDAAEAVWDVRSELKNQNLSPSPRHYKQAVSILQAQAWLEGRNEVVVEDLEVLSSVLPDKEADLAMVESVLVARCNPLHNDVLKLINGEMMNGTMVGGWAQLAEAVESAAALPADSTENRLFRQSQMDELTPKLKDAMVELKDVLAKPMSGKTKATAMRGKKLLVGTYYRMFQELHKLDKEDIDARLERLGFSL